MDDLRIGTRGSALALAQARLAAAGLHRLGGTIHLEIVETDGDRRRPDTAWGEGAFVKAIERALLDGRADVAVHSAKDVPTDEDPRLVIAAFLPRGDARDALVVRGSARSLADLATGAIVGTDSPRRRGFLLAGRPDLDVRPLHGNVDTRLRRLDAGEADALVLACAGLDRLGRQARICERIDPDVIPPAPGQGAIALQVRRDDERTRAAVAAVDDRPTRIAVEAERALLKMNGGGCRAPLGAFGEVRDGKLWLLGGSVEPDGTSPAIARAEGLDSDGLAIARALQAQLSRAAATVQVRS